MPSTLTGATGILQILHPARAKRHIACVAFHRSFNWLALLLIGFPCFSLGCFVQRRNNTLGIVDTHASAGVNKRGPQLRVFRERRVWL